MWLYGLFFTTIFTLSGSVPQSTIIQEHSHIVLEAGAENGGSRSVSLNMIDECFSTPNLFTQFFWCGINSIWKLQCQIKVQWHYMSRIYRHNTRKINFQKARFWIGTGAQVMTLGGHMGQRAKAHNPCCFSNPMFSPSNVTCEQCHFDFGGHGSS